ncbi:hypothetical protein [Nonomuraea sp. NPDC049400]|uniref:hypothetical protein n=1 Tax=Nonomuraea sp. NPDC049400 TaxID=3364352 RepID=UPI00379235D4
MIAVLGASGDVGRHAVRTLTTLGAGPLRLGGRTAAGHDAMAVDFRDDASLDRFAAGCRLVVNCAGPAHLVGDRVARAALRAGASYVDAAGDDVLHGLLDPGEWAGSSAVLSAGLQPGLTGLLPRWVAQRDFDEVHGLAAHLGVLDRFTATAADDYLQGAADGLGEPLAAWRDGRRAGALTRQADVTLPFFPGEVTLLPSLSTENARLAESLRLHRGDWYTVLSGSHIRVAFDRAHSLDRAEAVAALCRASLLDLAGREPYVILLLQLDGLKGGVPVTRTVVLRGRGNGELTGTVTALAAWAVIRGETPPGVHYAADALDPATTIERLSATGVTQPVTLDGLALAEEGAL